MPKLDGLARVRAAQALNRELSIIVMSAYGSHELAIEEMKAGAYDYLGKPFRPDEVLLVLRKAQERERLRLDNLRLRREVSPTRGPSQLVAEGAAMPELMRVAEKGAPTSTNIPIDGHARPAEERRAP